MTEINRQKFLAELGKLLTFMYEEDRQTALSMYNAIFDRAPDEMALIQKLVSPTRQAVLLARAYDARERKLQVHAQSRQELDEDMGDDVPRFIMVIDRIAEDLMGDYAPAPRAVLENQFSLFEDSDFSAPQAPAPAAEKAEERPGAQAEQSAPAQAEEAAMEPEESYDPLSDVEGFIPIDIPDISVPEADYAPALAYAAEEAPGAEEPIEAQPAEPSESGEEALSAEAAETAAEERGAAGAAPAESVPAPKAEERPAQEKAYSQADEGQQLMLELDELPPVPRKAETLVSEAPTTLRKARVFPLILYILAAIPLGLIGLLLLLVLTVLVLGLAVITVAAGVMLFPAAFGGFSVFADMLIVLGAAVIVLALGLLLLWLFVWLIGGAMVGFIRSLIRLGGKWCFKEVAAA